MHSGMITVCTHNIVSPQMTQQKVSSCGSCVFTAFLTKTTFMWKSMFGSFSSLIKECFALFGRQWNISQCSGSNTHVNMSRWLWVSSYNCCAWPHTTCEPLQKKEKKTKNMEAKIVLTENNPYLVYLSCWGYTLVAIPHIQHVVMKNMVVLLLQIRTILLASGYGYLAVINILVSDEIQNWVSPPMDRITDLHVQTFSGTYFKPIILKCINLSFS